MSRRLPTLAARDAGTAPTTRPDRATQQAELAKALASELKLDEAKVAAALAELDTARSAAAKDAFGARIDQAVTDGTLTADEAAAVKKAADAGVIGYGGHKR